MLVHLLPMKSREKLARDVFYTFATHSAFVYDVTETARHKMAALTVIVFATLKVGCYWILVLQGVRFFLVFFLGNSPRPATQKLCEKELCAYFLYSNFPYGAI